MTRRSIRSTLSLMVLCALISGGGAVCADRVSDAVALLSSINKYDRRAAIESLSALGDARAIQPLISRLGSQEDSPYAARALGAIGVPALNPLIEALSADSPITRKNAARALGVIGDYRAVRPLLDLLEDPDPGVREAAAAALAFSKTVAVVARMLTIYHHPDEEYEVRRAACNTLVGARDARAVRKVIDRLREDVAHRQIGTYQYVLAALVNLNDLEIIRALFLDVVDVYNLSDTSQTWSGAGERIIPSLITLLKHPELRVRFGAAAVLGVILEHTKDDRTVQPLVETMHEDSDERVRLAAMRALGGYGGDSVTGFLLKAVQDPNPRVRQSAVSAMRNQRSQETLEAVCTRLTDVDSRVVETAVSTLKEIGDASCIEPLVEIANDPSSSARSSALNVLSQTGDPRALDPLLGALKDTSGYVRSIAARCLGQMQSIEAVEPLIAALSDPDQNVRGSAAEALGRIGDRRAVEPLIDLLKSPEWEVRYRAEEALGALKDSRAVQPLLDIMRGDPAGEIGAAYALAAIGDPAAVEPMIEMLSSSDLEIETRHSVLPALIKFGDRRTLPLILATLHEDGQFSMYNAVMAFIDLRDPSTIGTLEELLHTKYRDVRWNAAHALSLFDDKQVHDILMPYAEKGDMEVIAGADQFFIKRGVERAIPALIDALNYIQPESTLPEGFVASGRPELVEAAKEYRATHPMAYQPEDGITYARWGEARR